MGIVTPPRGSKGAAPILKSGSPGTNYGSGGIAKPLTESKGAPKSPLNGGGGNSIPGYGSATGGPYQPVNPPQGRRSTAPSLH